MTEKKKKDEEEPEEQLARSERIAHLEVEAVGAAGGAVTGAVIGALAGPVGAAVGAVVGAAAGALAGKKMDEEEIRKEIRAKHLDDVGTDREREGTVHIPDAEPSAPGLPPIEADADGEKTSAT
jgi:phage tail tape-measure protein